MCPCGEKTRQGLVKILHGIRSHDADKVKAVLARGGDQG
jgi:hypothetical protein